MIIFIHRRDLRVQDLAAFEYIVRTNQPSIHLFILDPFLLRKNRANEHSGRNFLLHLTALKQAYEKWKHPFYILYGSPADIIAEVLDHTSAGEVVAHRDVTPYGKQRDRELKKVVEGKGARWTLLLDHLLMDPADFQSYAHRTEPYKVFTPFFNKWSAYMHTYTPAPYTTHIRHLHPASFHVHDARLHAYEMPEALEQTLKQMEPEAVRLQPEERLTTFLDEALLHYEQRRDRYGHEEATSGISRHLNVGALSIREVYQQMMEYPAHSVWRRQLAWRDFYLYQAMLDPFYFEYEKHYDLEQLSDHHFQAWATAQTGIPIIDAAMTQLNETGEMPNRLRMITAMFFTKNLLCPFPLGETYFRYKLADYDNTLNRGGWLWSSSLGYDASPYFRVMNPVSQSQKFDPDGRYLRKWLPHLAALPDRDIHLPQPRAIVDLKNSRARAIEVYKGILSKAKSNPEQENR
ncbi:cryptochrome/photolyase family protein [Marinicrinis sediminis]|uniref:Cryptochrome/photolyase family protein n=1 Tax=Marinicrinis sediminis TaxID=1652465 RepID=A0ABW5RED5_9BACL